jgi:4-amino-4-deoxychorismate lyase
MTQAYQCIETIDPADRGLAYGDGLFETIAYVNEQLHNWSLHWQRLILGCQRLAIDIPDEKLLLQQINLIIAQEKLSSSTSEKVVKIILTRGSGGRGYLFPEKIKPSLLISLHAWPETLEANYYSGVNTILCQTCLANQPALVGIKHLNRLEQVLARNEFAAQEFQEGLLLRCSESASASRFEHLLIEGVSSNLFFVIEGRLLTPKIDKSGVQGTIRQVIFHLVDKLAIEIEEGDYPLRLLQQASEVFFTNSIFGIVPMRSLRIDKHTLWTFNHNKMNIAAKLSRLINTALNRPEVKSLTGLK